ncbi:phage tail protein [Salmonella enterica]|uniref:Phage tail protein n=2 Tax=Salmonella enterica subsp. enterica serovar Lattenkamp TaxID=2564671 RepID=A0A734FQW7_SALET|nr:phage tail protein [Salmonella enterica subsp. enterica serovar Ealing]EAM2229702.1 phage tail protein [Salmonella enterica]EBG8047122.1 phage tail protein [Salmonella enterica subsp. enterica serovar Oranienburg]EBS5059157.1 phage tail protein [Salmonella enterica subsp. enterica serovar Anecho]EBW2671505.1 phage tail protein [Salmonella enterica subsp. enterica serovar Tennessee]EBW6031787.1 phage tail protein [Salmonella enterica subsp. enterica serovar Monschaui]ECG1244949.1 phage tail
MPAFPKFKTIITDYGKQRLIAAMSPGGTKLTLTQMAVGDGGGNPTNPDTTSTALVNEVWRAAVNSVTVDKKHPNIIIVELLIPAEVGGFWVREAGIYDEFNKLVAICSLPASEKPLLEQGSGRAQTVRMTLIVSDTSIVNITIDSTTIMATNEYVDNSLEEHEKSRNHPDATLTDKGFVKLYSGVDSLDETMAATPKAVKIAMDNASARLAKERNLADLTNIPLARQSLQLGNSATRNVGTTANTVAAGDDSRITGAMQKSQNGADIQNKPLFIENLGLGETINLAKNAVPATRRVNSKPLTGDITLSAADVNAFALGMTGDYTLENDKSVGWNWKSGVYNVPTGGASKLILHFNMNIGSCPAVQFCVNYKNGGISYRSARDGFGFELDWTEFYTTTRKPSAGDVGALPVSGGVINGNLGIGTPNILGGSSIVLGDNDTGLKQNGDGLLDIYANGVQVFRFQNDTLESKKSINVTGRLTPTDYGNFDSRYVQDIRLGSLQYGQVWNGPGFNDASGYVITGIINSNSDELVDGAHRRPIQKLIGNQWYNVVSI